MQQQKTLMAFAHRQRLRRLDEAARALGVFSTYSFAYSLSLPDRLWARSAKRAGFASDRAQIPGLAPGMIARPPTLSRIAREARIWHLQWGSARRIDIPQRTSGRHRRTRRLEANVGRGYWKRKGPLHKFVHSGAKARNSLRKPDVPHHRRPLPLSRQGPHPGRPSDGRFWRSDRPSRPTAATPSRTAQAASIRVLRPGCRKPCS